MSQEVIVQSPPNICICQDQKSYILHALGAVHGMDGLGHIDVADVPIDAVDDREEVRFPTHSFDGLGVEDFGADKVNKKRTLAHGNPP